MSQPSRSHSDSTPQLRALVADHDEANRTRVRFLLEDLDIDVAEEVNGSRASDRALNEAFDMILVANQLPILSGLDATKLLRSEGVETPIVCMVAGDATEQLQACIQAGSTAVIQHPIVTEQFEQIISSVLPSLQSKRMSRTRGVFTRIESDVRAIRQACAAKDLSRVALLVDKLRGEIEVEGVSSLDEPVRQLAIRLEAKPVDPPQLLPANCPQQVEFEQMSRPSPNYKRWQQVCTSRNPKTHVRRLCVQSQRRLRASSCRS